MLGCRKDSFILDIDNTEAVLLKSDRKTNPEKRKLVKIGKLSSKQLIKMKSLMENSKVIIMSYVSPLYYIKLGKKIIGIDISTSADTVGFDISKKDTSNMYITSKHKLLFPKKKKIGQ